MIPTPVLITFLLVVSIIFSPYYLLVLKPEEDEQRVLRRAVEDRRPSRSRPPMPQACCRTETPLSQIPVVNAVLGAAGIISRPMQRLIDRSGLNLTVGALILMCLCAGVAVFLLVQSCRDSSGGCGDRRGLLGTSDLVRGLQGEGAPREVRGAVSGSDRSLARALRAGHAFTTGLSMVAEEMPDPVGTEFRLAYDRQNFGMPMPDALKALGHRVPLLDARFS